MALFGRVRSRFGSNQYVRHGAAGDRHQELNRRQTLVPTPPDLIAQAQIRAVPDLVVSGIPAVNVRQPSVQRSATDERYLAKLRRRAQKSGPSAAQLQDRLLSEVGGSALDTSGCDKRMLQIYQRYGRYYGGTTAICEPNKTHNCHRNSQDLYRNGRTAAVATGFALLPAGDLWIEHSWAFTPDGRVLEATLPVPAKVYFGVPYRIRPADGQTPERAERLDPT